MRATMVIGSLVVVVLAAGVACADGGAPGAEPTAEATPTPTPAATPAPDKTPKPAGTYSGKKRGPGWSYVVIDGERMTVRWSDGDSFKFKDGPYDGAGVRMTAYNTLESYGPVHRWGTWTAQELYEIARESKNLGASQEWTCTTDGSRDGYNRVLVSCPDAALHFVQEGHAHVFGIDEPVSAALVKAQRVAQRKKVGIWAKGVPKLIITSLHSVDERWDDPSEGPYNRVVDTRTGESRKSMHTDQYAVCQEVCMGPKAAEACMTYVPFANRYRNKAECLKAPPKAQ